MGKEEKAGFQIRAIKCKEGKKGGRERGRKEERKDRRTGLERKKGGEGKERGEDKRRWWVVWVIGWW